MSTGFRVALFSDSFHGVDGVATTCRNIVEAARIRGWPMLAVHVGAENKYWCEGSVEFLELPRGPLSFELDRHLHFDMLFVRYFKRVLDQVRDFRPDVVHVTGPGDVGITGTQVAQTLRLPLVAALHTSVHGFAAKRLGTFLAPVPEAPRRTLVAAAEKLVLLACLRYYRIARVALAANDEDVRLVQAYTKKPVFPMRRGVNADLFSPAKRSIRDNTFRLGYVGRLCPEKNVRFLVDLEHALQNDGIGNYRFLMVGEGGERGWLERKLQKADFTGELHGEFLAEAYANMDLLVFPSETDTFGNVVLEALASGTPPLVTSKGGPKYLVEDGVTGFVARNESDFIAKAKLVIASPKLRLSLRKAARLWAEDRSWEMVLDDLGVAYQASLRRSAVGSQVTGVVAG